MVLASTFFHGSESRGTHDHISLFQSSGNCANTCLFFWSGKLLLASIAILISEFFGTNDYIFEVGVKLSVSFSGPCQLSLYSFIADEWENTTPKWTPV
jgi:hypothetical protein